MGNDLCHDQPDSLAPGQVMPGPEPWQREPGMCSHCVAGSCGRCWKAVCHHGCLRVPICGWPANQEAGR